MKILIIKISSLGDIIHAFPAVTLIVETVKDARIDWLVNATYVPLLKYHKDIESIISFPRRELASLRTFPSACRKLFHEIRRERYDIVIDMQGLLKSVLCARCARSGKVVGFEKPRECLSTLFYDEVVSVSSKTHALERNIQLVSQIFNTPFRVPNLVLPKLEEFDCKAGALLKQSGISEDDICIGIAPGARWKTKCWPPAFYAAILKMLAFSFPDLKFLLLGDIFDLNSSKAIIGKNASPAIIQLAGKSGMGELVELIRRCCCLICNDSGPMHIAAALKVPVFAMFGPTDPQKTGPFGEGHSVFQAELECIKCLRKYCPQNNYLCHESIDPALVVEKIAAILTPKMD